MLASRTVCLHFLRTFEKLGLPHHCPQAVGPNLHHCIKRQRVHLCQREYVCMYSCQWEASSSNVIHQI